MLEGLVAAGFYSCFYGRCRGAIWTGIGAAGLSLVAFFFPEIRFAVPLVTTFWIMLAGFLWAEVPGGKAAAGMVDRHEGRGERCALKEFRTGQREQLLLAGGIWLMARSLAEFGTGNALLQTGSLQTVLALALLLMVVLYLLGRGRLYPLWMAALAVLWLLTGFLGSIAYAWPWQNLVMTVSLYLAAGGILVFQQVSCVRQELESVQWKEPLSVKPDLAIEGSWQEAASREYRQLQIFEHDFRHHLDIVSALYEEGSAAEARAYIEDLKQARESRRGRKDGGERELSYIMMAKRQACREAEISFSYQIVGSPQGIAQMDMTALLLNLLDNAIRACKEAPKPRSIGVMLLSRGELWEIEMINSGHYEPEEGWRGEPQEGRRGEPQEGRQGEPQEGRQGEPEEGRQGEPQERLQRETQKGRQKETQERLQGEPQAGVEREIQERKLQEHKLSESKFQGQKLLESKLPEQKLSQRRLHGIGLVSVRQIVEKYQGTYRIWQEEGQVRQKLILVQHSSQESFPGEGSAE